LKEQMEFSDSCVTLIKIDPLNYMHTSLPCDTRYNTDPQDKEFYSDQIHFTP